MKITIDTKEDSNEDIRKVISLLSNLIGESGYISESRPSSGSSSQNIFEDESPAVGNIFGSMFGSDSADSGPAQSVQHSAISEPSQASPASASEPISIYSSSASQEQDPDEITDDERRAADLIMEY